MRPKIVRMIAYWKSCCEKIGGEVQIDLIDAKCQTHTEEVRCDVSCGQNGVTRVEEILDGVLLTGRRIDLLITLHGSHQALRILMKLKDLQLQRFKAICESENADECLRRLDSFDDFPATIVFGSVRDLVLRKKMDTRLGAIQYTYRTDELYAAMYRLLKPN